MTSKIKISLNDETRVMVEPKNMEEFKKKLIELLGTNLPASYRITYIDTDGDLIRVTTDSDLELAISQTRKFTIQPAALSAQEINKPQQQPNSNKPMEDTKEAAKPIPFSIPYVPYIPSAPPAPLAPSIPPVPVPIQMKEPVAEPMKVEEAKESGDIYVCLFCNGTKVNKKGTTCKKCKGSGKLPKALINRVRGIVQTELSKMFESEMQGHISQLLKSQRVIGQSQVHVSEIVHPGVICQYCGMNPIKGIRYKCSTCPEFDICEDCEKRCGHEHAMLKIRSPSQKPAAIFTAIKENPSVPSAPIYKIDKEEKKVAYKMKLIRENLEGQFEMAPGEQFTKKWILRNIGSTPWPLDTVLLAEGESSMKSLPISVGQVPPLGQVDVEAPLRAPANEGKHVTFFQLSYGAGVKFGERIWAEIIVKALEESSLKIDKGKDEKKEEKKEEKKAEMARQNEIDIHAALIKKLSGLKISEEYLENMKALVQMYPDCDAELLFTLLQEKNNKMQDVCDYLSV